MLGGAQGDIAHEFMSLMVKHKKNNNASEVNYGDLFSFFFDIMGNPVGNNYTEYVIKSAFYEYVGTVCQCGWSCG